jgi:hypothetical protein
MKELQQCSICNAKNSTVENLSKCYVHHKDLLACGKCREEKNLENMFEDCVLEHYCISCKKITTEMNSECSNCYRSSYWCNKCFGEIDFEQCQCNNRFLCSLCNKEEVYHDFTPCEEHYGNYLICYSCSDNINFEEFNCTHLKKIEKIKINNDTVTINLIDVNIAINEEKIEKKE